MVHEKYTNKNGKKYGPYLYENKRVDGQVVTTYLGSVKDTHEMKESSLFFLRIFSFVLIVLILYLLFALPIFFNEEYSFHSFFSDFFSFKKEVFLSPPAGFFIGFELPTFPNNAVTGNTSIPVNVSIGKDIQELIFNWNGTNYTLYDSSLFFMYNFDNRSALKENDSFIRDLGSKGMNLTCNNCNQITKVGYYGGGLKSTNAGTLNFKGSDVDVLGNITITAWVNTTGSSTKRFIISKSNACTNFPGEWAFQINDIPDELGFDCGGTISSLIGIAVTKNIWNFVAVSFNSDTNEVVLQVNDKNATFTNIGECLADSLENITIAGAESGTCSTRQLNGTLDELKVWNRILSAREIQQQYFSNLYRYNQTLWYLYVNQSKNFTAGLGNGTYTYFTAAKDKLGYRNQTETRTVTIGGVSCGLLSQQNSVYNLMQDVTAGGTCFNVTANNVTINCNGYSINYSISAAGDGIFSSSNYTAVNNCILRRMSNVQGTGIFFLFARDSIIQNATVSNAYNGITIDTGSVNASVLQSTFFNNSNNGVVINADNATVRDIFSKNNSLFNLIFSGSGGNIQRGVVINSDLNDTRSNFDFVVSTVGYSNRIVNVTAINTTFLSPRVQSDPSGANSIVQLEVRWWLDFLVNRSSGSLLQDANISGIDKNNKVRFSEFTDATGKIPSKNLTEYIIVNDTTVTMTTYFTNYTINVSKAGYITQTRSINLTSSRFEIFTLSPVQNIIDCVTIDVPNNFYILRNNIKSSGTCITISADNVTLDGSGFTINYSYASAGSAVQIDQGKENVTIKNLRIVGGFSDISSGILINSGQNISIFNNSIRAFSGMGIRTLGVFTSIGTTSHIYRNNITTYNLDGDAIVLEGSVEANISENKINTLGSSSYGIYMKNLGASNPYPGVFRNNTITTFGSSGDAIHIESGSFNVIENNIITTYGNIVNGIILNIGTHFNNISNNNVTVLNSNNAGIKIADSSNNTLRNDFIFTNDSAQGIDVQGSSYGNQIYDSFVNSSGTQYDLRFISTFVGSVNLTNVTLANNKISYLSSSGVLNVHWYVDALALNNTLPVKLPLMDVNISALDKNGGARFSQKTAANGKIQKQVLLDYSQTGPSAITYYSPHSFKASLPDGSENLTQIWNITKYNNLNLTFIFGLDLIAPNIFFVPPTPLNGSVVGANISVSLSTSDLNDHYAFVDFDKSLFLWMRMDDRNSTGTPLDLSTYGNNGTLIGNALINSTGRFGDGAHFDGAGDYMNISNVNTTLSGVKAFTVSAWAFARSSTNDFSRIWSAWNNGFEAWTNNTNGTIILRLNMSGTNYDIKNTTAFTYQVWHHVVFTFNGSALTGYVDGVASGSILQIGTVFPLGSWFRIGASSGISSGSWNGTIDEVIIFNRSLSSNETKALYNASANQYMNNFTSLSIGSHRFTGYAVDIFGNKNQTEERVVSTDSAPPGINFTNPTLPNATVTSNSSVEINVSIAESQLGDVMFRWNGTNYTFYNDSLLLMYNFENLVSLGESSTFVRDLSIYGNNGSVENGVSLVNGKYGKAFDFDSIDDVINASSQSVLDDLQQLTVTAWIYPRSNGENHRGRIVNKAGGNGPSNGWALYFPDLPNSFTLHFAAGYSGTPPILHRESIDDAIQPNKWQHVAATWDGSNNANNVRLYIDGQEVQYDQTTNGGGTRESDALQDFLVGNSKDGQRTFDGSIDEVRVWNRVLSADEVKEQYYSNLFKYNETLWYLYVNQSNLTESPYYYQAFAKDVSGNENSTEERILYVDFPINITDISNLTPQNILPGGVRNISFSVDITGINNRNGIINVNASISRESTARYNSSCAFVNQIGSIFNYSCRVDLWYFDPYGEWNVSVNAYEARFGSYRRETFQVGSTIDISNPGSISWVSLLPGDINQILPFLLNNTANQFISSVRTKGIDLIGQSIGNNIIPARNFTVGTQVGICSGNDMINGTSVLLTGVSIPVSIPVGNNSINTKDASSGQEELFICLRQVPIGLPPQAYSAERNNAWEITIA